MSGVRFVMRTFAITPADDGKGYEIAINPALPGNVLLAIRPTYDEALAQALRWAHVYGGGISKTCSRR